MEEENFLVEFLKRRGIAERSQASALASILATHVHTAKRRLSEPKSLALEELLLISEHFGAPILEIVSAFAPQSPTSSLPAWLDLSGKLVACYVRLAPLTDGCATLVAHTDKNTKELIVATPQTLDRLGKTPQFLVRSLDFDAVRDRTVPRVIVVDDDPPRALLRYLNDAGFSVEFFKETAPAIEQVHAKQFADAYVLDWSLENGRSSLDLIEAIRAASPDIPITVLTGTIHTNRSNELSIAQTIARFGVDFLEKPTRLAVLAEMLRRQTQLTI